jgi:hypothetical protein
MTFKLRNIVPWMRTLAKYISMFKLTDIDLDKKIISFGNSPASFNYEMTKQDFYFA